VPVEEVTALLNRSSVEPLEDRGTTALFQAASDAFKSKDFGKAADFYAAVVLLTDDSAAAYNARLAQAQAGNKDDAARYFRLYLRFAPPDDANVPRVRNWLAGGASTAEQTANPRPTQTQPPTVSTSQEGSHVEWLQQGLFTFTGMVGTKEATLRLDIQIGQIGGQLWLGGGTSAITIAHANGSRLSVYAQPYLLEGKLDSAGGVFSGEYTIWDPAANEPSGTGHFTLRVRS
jgi:hypothetical protein